MKILALFLCSLLPATALFAQNPNNIYADVSITNLAVSATYDRKLTKHLQLGAGIKVFDNTYSYKNITSALFVDVRPYWLKRKNLFFLLADAGLATHFGNAPHPATYETYTAGFYSSLGFGYSRIVTKNGMGPYISVGLRAFSVRQHNFNPTLPSSMRDYSVLIGMNYIALGFKF